MVYWEDLHLPDKLINRLPKLNSFNGFYFFDQ